MTTAPQEPAKGPGPPESATADEGGKTDRIVIRDKRKIKVTDEPATTDSSGKTTVDAGPDAPAPEPAAPVEPPDESPAAEAAPAESAAPDGLGAELAALRSELDERTRDLQRITAEYANYRRRVERDKTVAADEATATVFRALLPVFDDLERAREHGELSEGVAAVVDQLLATAGKFGLTPFGEQGEPFDPNRHEAVAHMTSPDVTESSCVEVLRRGYLLGDRLLRPAMVAVADPAPEPAPTPPPTATEAAEPAAPEPAEPGSDDQPEPDQG